MSKRWAYASGFVVDEEGRPLATINDDPSREFEDSDANGALMAAAPELRASLAKLCEAICRVLYEDEEADDLGKPLAAAEEMLREAGWKSNTPVSDERERLMAAAPELLAVCLALGEPVFEARFIDIPPKLREQLSAAVKKARDGS